MHNDKAHCRKEFTVEDALSARAPAFALTVPMCAPITDGAAAVVVCGARGLRRLASRGRSVPVLASVVGTGVGHAPAAWDQHISGLAAMRAYVRAGLGPQDIDTAELHDATAFGELQQTELLGLFEPGAGGAAAEAGVRQVPGARIAIADNSGGFYAGEEAAAAITILAA